MPPLNLKELFGLEAGDLEGLLRHAVEHYSAGRMREAEVVLAGLTLLAENDARPFKLLGSALLLQDRHTAAERVYTRACELDPKDPYTLVALGELRLKAYDIKGALPLFERLFALDPHAQHPAANRGRAIIKAFHREVAARKKPR